MKLKQLYCISWPNISHRFCTSRYRLPHRRDRMRAMNFSAHKLVVVPNQTAPRWNGCLSIDIVEERWSQHTIDWRKFEYACFRMAVRTCESNGSCNQKVTLRRAAARFALRRNPGFNVRYGWWTAASSAQHKPTVAQLIGFCSFFANKLECFWVQKGVSPSC